MTFLACLMISMAMASAGAWRSSRLVVLHSSLEPDLPCPWCSHATFEEDSACRSCGQNFG